MADPRIHLPYSDEAIANACIAVMSSLCLCTVAGGWWLVRASLADWRAWRAKEAVEQAQQATASHQSDDLLDAIARIQAARARLHRRIVERGDRPRRRR